MKKLILTAAMIIGLSAATVVEANDHIFTSNVFETDLTVKALKGLKFKVTAFNLTELATVELKDNSGATLYKSEVINGEYVKVLDLSSLPDGDYSIVLSKGKDKTVKPFEIKTETTRLVSSL